MAKTFPTHPAHPERICWGCEQFCAAGSMACANERSPHPAELFGENWQAWGEQPWTPVEPKAESAVPAKMTTENI